jgi:cytochrome c oxidase assembly protein subunit 15
MVTGTVVVTAAQTSTKWLHRLAVLAARLTLVLVFAGSQVTSYDVGMAVPDWPTSFGQPMLTFNFLAESFGVQVEHSHRLLGIAVGLATLALAVAVVLSEPRRWVCWLAGMAVAGVVAQGVLGGMRVRLNAIAGRELAVLHGLLAHAFFGLMVLLCVITADWWTQAKSHRHPHASRLRYATVFLVLAVSAQTVIGAVLRHFGLAVGLLVVHVLIAAGVIVVLFWLAVVTATDGILRPMLVKPVMAVLGITVTQAFLGLGSLLASGGFIAPGVGASLSHGQALVASLHVITGSLVLSGVLLSAAIALRRLEPEPSAATTQVPAPELEVAR